MKLILDFDDVLFNTKELKETIFKTLSKCGIENGQEFYEKERNSGVPFSLKRFLYHACDYRSNTDTVVVDFEKMYEQIMNDCPRLLNQELVGIIMNTGKENCYIVTNGDEEFQREKIKRVGIENLVQGVFVVEGSKKETIKSLCVKFSNEEIIFVDDKNKFIADIDMEECSNLKTVIYNENGFGNLKAEMAESKNAENGTFQKFTMR